MTQKNESPERLWVAYTDQTYQGKRGITISDEPVEGHICFIPERHAQAELQAAVAAEREVLSDLANEEWRSCKWQAQHEGNAMSFRSEASYGASVAKGIALQIRARTDTDAQAALEARDKRVRAEALRDVVELMRERWAMTTMELEEAITDMIEKDQADE